MSASTFCQEDCFSAVLLGSLLSDSRLLPTQSFPLKEKQCLIVSFLCIYIHILYAFTKIRNAQIFMGIPKSKETISPAIASCKLLSSKVICIKGLLLIHLTEEKMKKNALLQMQSDSVSAILLTAIALFISSTDFISLIMMSYEFHVRNNFSWRYCYTENK